MPRTTSLRRAAAIAAVLAAVAPASLNAGTPSSLEGQELAVTGELNAGVESALGSLIAGQLNGEVTAVRVSSDAADRVVIRVSYTGFEGARMWGEVFSSDRRLQKWIVADPPVSITLASGDVELSLQATGAPPAGASRSSAFLRLSVAGAGRTMASFRRTYRLPKTWGGAAAAQAEIPTVIRVTLLPVGSTASLGTSPSYVVPPKPATSTTPTSTSPPTAGSTTPRLMTARTLSSSPAPPPARTPMMARTITGTTGSGGTSVAMRTTAAAKVLPKSAAIMSVGQFHFGVPSDAQNQGATGPGPMAIRPFAESVKTEDIDLDVGRILNIFPEIYQDQTASSGVFYYLPNTYHLRWDPDGGYELKQLYSGAVGAAAGEVMMAARLDAGIGQREERVASGIVRDYAQRHKLPFTALRPLAIDSVRVSFSGGLGMFEIPSDRVAVHGLSDVLGQLDVAWVTNERTRDFILETLLQDIGVAGTVTFRPSGGGLGSRQVEVRMLIADPGTFGAFAWTRHEPWRNRTPYPIRLRYLHALRHQPGNPAVVHTWSLGDTRVTPNGIVAWDASRVPGWIDSEASRMWLDYSIERDCAECDQRVVETLTGGVSRAGSAQITFHTLSPLADVQAHELNLEVRSRYFDPESREEQMRTVVLDKDGAEFKVGPLFGTPATPAGPLFYYRLAVVFKDGRSHKGVHEWIPSEDLRVPIGRHQLETSLGSLPPP